MDNSEGSENIEDSISSEDNNNSSKNDNILFNIDVKLSDTKMVKLHINENDDIKEKVSFFCEAYKIKPELQPLIKKIIENKLNQELSANKNSSTESSSGILSNIKEKITENKNYKKINNDGIILKGTKKPKDNLRNKIDKNKKNIQKPKSNNYNNGKINFKNNNNLNKNKNILKNPVIILNNKINNNKNKHFQKPKKLNVLKINNPNLIRKRPNSTGNYKNLKKEDKLYNNYMNSSPRKKLYLQEKHKDKDEDFKYSPKIDKNSQMIWERCIHSINNKKVEDRLINYGEKINQKKLKAQTNSLLEDIKNNTFSPKINNNSRYIADNKKKDRINQITKIQNLLSENKKHSYNKNTKNKNLNLLLEKGNKIQEKNKIEEQTIDTFVSFGKNLFKQESEVENPKDSFNKNIFDCLYLESKIDKLKKDKKINNFYKNKYTFRPQISNLAKELKKENNETNQEFLQRLSSLPKNEAKPLKEKLNSYYDDKNRFSSKKGKKINEKKKEISVDLEGFYDKKLIKQKEDLKNEEIINDNKKKKYYFKKSSELINKMKNEKYKLLFDFLDSDKDGLISYDKIKLTGINNNILASLSPILEELYESKKSFDYKTFFNKIEI